MMIGKKTRPAIGKLIVPGNRAGFMDTSPRTPLEFKIGSPRLTPLNNLHAVGGVGFGIVAALVDKSGNMMMNGGETPAKKAFCGRNLNRSDPFPVNNYSGGHNNNNNDIDRGVVDENRDRLEEYTYVTCHKPNKSMEYSDGGEYRRSSGGGCLFEISPARFGDSITVYPAAAASDFLSSCHLCQKKLHGKDIYMFRGEKAFCSTECRYRQIGMEERREHCSSQASRSSSCANGHMFSTGIQADVSISSCANGHMFSTGILAI